MSEQDVQTVRSGHEAFVEQPATSRRCWRATRPISSGSSRAAPGNAPSGTFNGTDQVQQQVFALIPENFVELFG